MNRRHRKSALFLAALGASLSVPAVHGQTPSWTGGVDNSWGNGNNWNTSTVPGSTDIAVFNGPGGVGGTNISLAPSPNPQTVGAVEFDTSSAASYDLGTTPGDTLTINNASISSGAIGAVGVTSAVTNAQEIDASLIFTNAAPFITNASTAGLTLGALNTTATLSSSAATPTSLSIRLLGASPTTITINDAITGNIGGSTTAGTPNAGAAGTATGGLILNGTSGVSSVLVLNGQNTYTGITNLNGGGTGNPVTILIGSNSAFGNSTLVPNNTTQTPLEACNGDRTLSNAINMVGGGFTVANAAAGAHNLTFTGPMTFSSGASRTITVNTFGQTFTLGASPGSNTFTLASSASSGNAFNVAFNPAAMSDGTNPATLVINDIIQDQGSPTIPDTISVNSSGTNGPTPMGIIRFNGANTFAGGVTINGQGSAATVFQAITVQVGVSSVGSGSLVTSGAFGKGTLTWSGNTSASNGSGPGFLEPFGGDRTIGNNVTLTTGFFAQEAGGIGNTSNSLTLTGNISAPNGRLLTNNLPSTAALTFGSASAPANITGKFFVQGQLVAGSVTNVNDNIIDTSASSLSSLLVQGAGATGVTTMNLTGSNTYTGGTSVKTGATLNTNTNFSNGSLTFSNGSHGPAKGVVQVQLTPGATAGVTVVPALSIDGGSSTPTSQLDITNNGLIDNDTSSGAFTTIQNQIKNAATNGVAGGNATFLGGGITSSTAATVAANTSDTHKTAVGYALASSLGFTGPGTFLGASFSSTSSILARYTLAGDANLDGIVNALDFNALAANYGTTSNGNWVQGDFNYDGSVDSNDFGLIATNFGNNIAAVPSSSEPLDSVSALGTLVPEPTSMSLLGLSILALRRRRKV